MASSGGFSIPEKFLNELCMRFIVNMPDGYNSMITVFFQIELAHWFYLDNYMEAHEELKKVKIQEFAFQMCRHAPLLDGTEKTFEELFSEWLQYKYSVPTFGCIMLNKEMTETLLVEGFSHTWAFPGGKVNENEEDYQCAIRETMEEAGFDVSSRLIRKDFFRRKVGDRNCTMFIIQNVPTDYDFKPQTKGEVLKCRWHSVDQLATAKENKHFMVKPFAGSLKKWVAAKREEQELSELANMAPQLCTPTKAAKIRAAQNEASSSSVKGISSGSKKSQQLFHMEQEEKDRLYMFNLAEQNQGVKESGKRGGRRSRGQEVTARQSGNATRGSPASQKKLFPSVMDDDPLEDEEEKFKHDVVIRRFEKWDNFRLDRDAMIVAMPLLMFTDNF